MSDNAFEHVEDLLPARAVPEAMFRVVGYLDEETGEQMFHYDFEGEVPIATTVGLLVMSLVDVLHDRMHEADYDHGNGLDE